MNRGESSNIVGVPDYSYTEISEKSNEYCLLIPVINEGKRIRNELRRAFKYGVPKTVDIVICDGGSTDDSISVKEFERLGINTILVKLGLGKQGAQLRMGMHWALKRGYSGILTIDGNNKDSIEHVQRFIDKLKMGYGYVQGSRFIKGGHAVRTPIIRYCAIKVLHAPIISFAAKCKYTDTTNNFRAYSSEYLRNSSVAPLRDVFNGYELLAYLSVRASQLGYKTCEVPVDRVYPDGKTVPTKISGIKGNIQLFKILIYILAGRYNP